MSRKSEEWRKQNSTYSHSAIITEKTVLVVAKIYSQLVPKLFISLKWKIR